MPGNLPLRVNKELPMSLPRVGEYTGNSIAYPADYDKIKQGDELRIDDLLEAIKSSDTVKIVKADGSFELTGKLELSDRDREILLSAGLLNYTRKRADG